MSRKLLFALTAHAALGGLLLASLPSRAAQAQTNLTPPDRLPSLSVGRRNDAQPTSPSQPSTSTQETLAGSAPSASAAQPANELTEVIVTAGRRKSTLQRTPQAVTVLNGALQRERGQQNLGDIQLTAPNVNFSATNNTSQLYIRGIGNTFIVAGGDPGVALYQDNAYVSDQSSTNTSQFDVDRIEVLRGPQGALYGRNAVGGAINILSAHPTDSFHAYVDALVGDFGRKESQGFVSGPTGLADTDFRVSYQVRDFDGYTRNQLAGQPGAPDRLDDLKSRAVRVQTLTRLPRDSKLNLLFSYYREDDNGAALSVEPYNGFVYPTQAIFGSVPNSTPRLVQANVGFNKLSVYTFNAELVQPLGDYTLTSTANYRDSKQVFINDCDGTLRNTCTYYRNTSSQDWYGDIHLTSPDTHRFRWLGGLTALRFNQSQLNYVNFTSLASYLAPGPASNIPFQVPTYTGGRVDTTSYAGYLDLHYKLTPVFAVTGQVRYSATTKDANEYIIYKTLGIDVPSYKHGLRTISVPYKLALEAQVTPQILFYADYATARKDAAINLGAGQRTPVRPENVYTEELGAKTTFLDRRLQLNVALFNSDYDDLQISQLVGINIALSNAPHANIKGGELEIVALPTAGLRLSLNGGFLDSRFEEFSNGRTLPGAVGGPVLNLKGNRLPYVSPLTLNFDAAYTAPAVQGFVPAIEIQYSFRDRVYFDEFNDISNSQKGVGLLNVTGSVTPVRGSWRIYGYIHNLTDETVVTGASIYAGLLGAERSVDYAAPRNFGVGASYSF